MAIGLIAPLISAGLGLFGASKARKDAKAQAEIDNKTSAQNKLKALGLTDAEIEAL